ncbi:MAG: hypothetical protein GXC78_04200 [Chitinophagaceae bacterium]|nr:hypothetical protein [Chitinophagaceae bacterium]
MKYLFFLAILITTSTITACNNAAEDDPAATNLPPLEVTAVKLLADYEADENAAGNLYGGRNLVITGAVMSIDKKPDGSAIILLNSDQSSIGSVRCHFSAEKAAALAAVERKDSIIVKGVCSNMDSHVQVVVTDCSISSPAQEAANFSGKPKDHPNNQKATEEIRSDLFILDNFISDSGILYVSVSKDTENLNTKIKEIRKILEKHQSTIRWIKMIEFGTANPSNPDNAFGVLLAEERW